MSFVPAFPGARLRFLLTFQNQGGQIVDVPAGDYVCRFYDVRGGAVAFEFSTLSGTLIVRNGADKGIEFNADLSALPNLKSKTYLWQIDRIATPLEWMASGDLNVGEFGGVDSRFRVFEAFNGVLHRVVAPVFDSVLQHSLLPHPHPQYLRAEDMDQFVEPDAFTVAPILGGGESLLCNPTQGSDFRSMADWAAGENRGNRFVDLIIASGMHELNTHVYVDNGRLLAISSAEAPLFYNILSCTFTLVSGNIYRATPVLDAPLHAVVAPGFAVGSGNVKGDGSACALNGGYIVETVAENRLSFSTLIRIWGKAPTDFTTPDNTAIPGMLPNQLLVPKSCLRVKQTGWNGSGIEGFLNVYRGGRIILKNIGISYDGVVGPQDLMFAADNGSEINLLDRVVAAGAGAMLMRTNNRGSIKGARGCVGGGTTATKILQCSEGGTTTLTRFGMGSVSGEGLSASSGGQIFASQGVLANCYQAARVSVEEANIVLASMTVAHSDYAATAVSGTLGIDVNSKIMKCLYPGSLAGGLIKGLPQFIDNTYAAPDMNVFSSNGGGWSSGSTFMKSPEFSLVNVITAAGIDFPSIPNKEAGTNYADLDVDAPGAKMNDIVLFVRNNSAIPAQPILYDAFMLSAEVPDPYQAPRVRIRATNVGNAAVNPTAQTGVLYIFRAKLVV